MIVIQADKNFRKHDKTPQCQFSFQFKRWLKTTKKAPFASEKRSKDFLTICLTCTTHKQKSSLSAKPVKIFLKNNACMFLRCKSSLFNRLYSPFMIQLSGLGIF